VGVTLAQGSTVVISGITSASPIESPIPTCDPCSWVQRNGQLALKLINMHCNQHGWNSGLSRVPWRSVSGRGYWAVGHQS
jgi:hypothetical protein